MTSKGYRRWSRDITRQVNNMLEKDKQAIIHIMDVNAERTREYLVNNMPVETGELQRNVFLDHYETDNGYGVGVGISSTQHNPDNFTNTKLAGWLLNKPNKPSKYRKASNSQKQMQGIIRELEGLKWNVKWDIEDYWKSKQK